MQSTTLFPSLPDPLWPGVVEPARVLPLSQIGQTKNDSNSIEYLLFTHKSFSHQR